MSWSFEVIGVPQEGAHGEFIPGVGVNVPRPQRVGFNETCVGFVICVGPWWPEVPARANASVYAFPTHVRYTVEYPTLGSLPDTEDPEPPMACNSTRRPPLPIGADTAIHVDATVDEKSYSIHAPLSTTPCEAQN